MRPYRYIERLNEGGYGEVWRVVDATGRPLALKRLLDCSPTFVESMWNEVTKLSRVAHVAGVIKIVDYEFNCDVPFIVMELAECSLLDLIQSPTTPVVAARVTLDLIAIVQGIHRSGVIHQDLKPDNLLIKDGTMRLADFGLGKGFGSILMTIGGAGTPGYMAPEQYDGVGLSEMADVYGVGATLYHLLTGERPPVDAFGLDPRQRVPDCPKVLAAIVGLMTAPDKRARLPLRNAAASLRGFIAHHERPQAEAPDARRSTGTSTQSNGAALLVIGGLIAFALYMGK